MRMKTQILTILLLTALVFGSVQTLPMINLDYTTTHANVHEELATSGFASENISLDLLSPVDQSSVSGIFHINLNITSDYGPLNLTLYVEEAIDPSNNNTLVGSGTNWIQDVTVNTLSLPEGMLNFTVLVEFLNATVNEKESTYLLYFVDNDGMNFEMSLMSPANGSTTTGDISLSLNITSDFDFVNLTLLIRGIPYAPYIGAQIPAEDIILNVDTLDLREGWLNFTVVFEYDIANVKEIHTYFYEFLVDNDAETLALYLQSPSNNTQVMDDFNLTVTIASNYRFANLTLFVDDVINYPAYNKTYLPDGIHQLELDTNNLTEGILEFRILLEYNMTGEEASRIYRYFFEVDNHGEPRVVFISPEADAYFTGIDDIVLNITSDYSSVHLTIYVDGAITDEYNNTLVGVGQNTYSINGSRYSNGNHLITVNVTTEEGLQDIEERSLFFLDHVYFVIDDITNFDLISGIAQIPLIISTPYDNVTVTVFVDDVEDLDVGELILPAGRGLVAINTTKYSEGEHRFTFEAMAPNGYCFRWSIILEVDNHGAPSVRFILPRDDMVVGLASFTIEIESTWDQVNITVYVDDEIVPTLNGTLANVGEYTFAIDTNAYTKWEHSVKVVVTTSEGETDEVIRQFGFANFKIEEIISLAVILMLAFVYPIIRWRRGSSIRPVIVADLLFCVVVVGIFIAAGINSLATIVWHINLASIWAIGAAVVATNWIVPVLVESQSE